MRLRSGVPVELDDESILRASFSVREGERVGFALRRLPVETQPPPEPTVPADVADRIADTVEAWRAASGLGDDGLWCHSCSAAAPAAC